MAPSSWPVLPQLPWSSLALHLESFLSFFSWLGFPHLYSLLGSHIWPLEARSRKGPANLESNPPTIAHLPSPKSPCPYLTGSPQPPGGSSVPSGLPSHHTSLLPGLALPEFLKCTVPPLTTGPLHMCFPLPGLHSSTPLSEGSHLSSDPSSPATSLGMSSRTLPFQPPLEVRSSALHALVAHAEAGQHSGQHSNSGSATYQQHDLSQAPYPPCASVPPPIDWRTWPQQLL